ncbi:hypothetical protein B0H16DRAFT_1449181 [Mycena metata]|uniref:Uncharacterized protein n=1 Tax=Mycena metata TaxID=1033252 RepID=A0AAD7K5E4_9AGAR|nr:hypothetical protein B0H16DRAFT_1449181 [Mycena metata]
MVGKSVGCNKQYPKRQRRKDSVYLVKGDFSRLETKFHPFCGPSFWGNTGDSVQHRFQSSFGTFSTSKLKQGRVLVKPELLLDNHIQILQRASSADGQGPFQENNGANRCHEKRARRLSDSVAPNTKSYDSRARRAVPRLDSWNQPNSERRCIFADDFWNQWNAYHEINREVGGRHCDLAAVKRLSTLKTTDSPT